ncbi:MAG: hypothetical protein HQM14_09430 [SAR324 cluster bacterium]|nr:hypothetical protein [SAR324 cluster bacterium]
MGTKLYLDDIRPAPEGWVLAKSYQEFVNHITHHGLPGVISFDHDLASEHYPWSPQTQPFFTQGFIDYSQYSHKTGYDCAKWLLEYCAVHQLGLPKWSVHSQNVLGAMNIEQILNQGTS